MKNIEKNLIKIKNKKQLAMVEDIVCTLGMMIGRVSEPEDWLDLDEDMMDEDEIDMKYYLFYLFDKAIEEYKTKASKKMKNGPPES